MSHPNPDQPDPHPQMANAPVNSVRIERILTLYLRTLKGFNQIAQGLRYCAYPGLGSRILRTLKGFHKNARLLGY